MIKWKHKIVKNGVFGMAGGHFQTDAEGIVSLVDGGDPPAEIIEIMASHPDFAKVVVADTAPASSESDLGGAPKKAPPKKKPAAKKPAAKKKAPAKKKSSSKKK